MTTILLKLPGFLSTIFSSFFFFWLCYFIYLFVKSFLLLVILSSWVISAEISPGVSEAETFYTTGSVSDVSTILRFEGASISQDETVDPAFSLLTSFG